MTTPLFPGGYAAPPAAEMVRHARALVSQAVSILGVDGVEAEVRAIRYTTMTSAGIAPTSWATGAAVAAVATPMTVAASGVPVPAPTTTAPSTVVVAAASAGTAVDAATRPRFRRTRIPAPDAERCTSIKSRSKERCPLRKLPGRDKCSKHLKRSEEHAPEHDHDDDGEEAEAEAEADAEAEAIDLEAVLA